MKDITVIIPAYKNKKQLISNLDHNIKFFKDCEVIVINDDPSESIAEDLKKHKQLILLENTRNMGFGATVNIGAHRASRSHIFLLNTDVKLFDDSFLKTLRAFENDQALFGVSFAQKERDGVIIGKNRIYWQSGFIYHKRADNLTSGQNGWAEGGSCIIDKEKFLKLGGFDPLYSPFYWEDTDLSYRAWKAGYNVLFDPDVEVEHHHESTIGKYFRKDSVKIVDFRNQLIFIWKNVTELHRIIIHIFYLKLILIRYTLKGDLTYLKGYFEAVKRLPIILTHRFSQKKQHKLTDSEVLKKIHE